MIEILVVITVVAVLLLLVGYGINRAVGVAHNIECASNLRTLALTNLRYAGDHYGTLASGASSENGNSRPRHLWWRYNLRTYLGAANGDGTPAGDQGFCPTLLCPSDESRGGEDASGNVGESLRRSYNVNAKLERRIQGVRVRYQLQEIREPSLVMYMADANWSQAGRGEFINGDSLNHLNGLPRDWHSGSVNVVFLDAHVELLAIDALYPGEPGNLIFDPNR